MITRILACSFLLIGSASASGAESVQEALQAIQASPVLAEGAEARWSGEYVSLSDFSLDDITGEPVPKPVTGTPPVSTFEVLATLKADGTHVKLVPNKTHERHKLYSFGRGMDFWDRAEGSDVVAYNDDGVAHTSKTFGRVSAFPTDIPSPYRLLTVALSPDHDVWAKASLDVPSTAYVGLTKPTKGRVTDDDSGMTGIRQEVTLPKLLDGGKPAIVARELFFAEGNRKLPRVVKLFVGNRCVARWDITWDDAAEAVRPRTLSATQYSLSDPAAALSRVTYSLAGVQRAPGAADLDVRIPENYELIDLDAPPGERSEGSRGWSPGWLTTLGLVFSAAVLVVIVLMGRRALQNRRPS